MASVEALTPAEWRIRLDSERAAVGAPPRETLGELTLPYRDLTLRTRAVHRSEWLVQPALGSVHKRLQTALALSQLLAEEFQRPDHAAVTSIRLLLSANAAELHVVEQQLTLCDLVHEVAEQLHPLVDQLVYGGETSVRRLLNLTEELTESMRDYRGGLALVPLEAQQLEQSLATTGWARSDWFVQALLAARLTAEFTRELADVDDAALPLVTAAALVQDIGAWHQSVSQAAIQGRLARGGRHRADPNHPASGAALLAGLVDVPARLCLLVGEHHERVDGTGFPRRLAGTKVVREVRWLGIVIRYVELLTDPLTNELSLDHGDPLFETAALRLWREVRRGAFEETLAQRLMEALRPRLAIDITTRYAGRQRRLVDGRHLVPAPRGRRPEDASASAGLRTDAAPAESAVGAPAFFRRQRDGQRRTVFIPPVPARRS